VEASTDPDRTDARLDPAATATPQRRLGDVVVDLGFADRGIVEATVALARATRGHPELAVGASPRGSLALLKLARCKAVVAGRDFVVLDDVKAVAAPALAHRLVLRPELWVRRVSAEDVVREVLAAVPTPRAEDIPSAR